MSEINDSQRQQILEAIQSGRKIEAIKLYRESAGVGLKEAKEFVEALTAQLLESDPNAIQSSKAGCGAAAIAVVTATGTLVAVFT